MSKKIFHKVGTVALVAAMAVPFAANAESTLATGSGGLNTSARVDFQITIPKFVSLRVGAAGNLSDLISFAPTAAQMEALTPVTGTGGDATGGAVNAVVRGNGGAVTLSAATAGNLLSGANAINWSQITTATTSGLLTPPALANGASVSTAVAPAANGVVNQSAVWTYTFTNSAVVPAGIYGGVGGAGNGRVTYTATVL